MTIDELVSAIEGNDTASVAAAVSAEPSLATARTRDNDTLLHIACWQKRPAIVEVLLQHGADANARGLHGWTALHYAVRDGSRTAVPVVELLVAHGADPRIRDDNGFDAIEWARREVWEGLDVILRLFGVEAAPPPPPVDEPHEVVVARMQAIQRRHDTEVALNRLLRSFSRDKTIDLAAATKDLPAADAGCVADAVRVLEALAATSWGEPMQRYLARELRGADIVRMLDQYETAN